MAVQLELSTRQFFGSVVLEEFWAIGENNLRVIHICIRNQCYLLFLKLFFPYIYESSVSGKHFFFFLFKLTANPPLPLKLILCSDCHKIYALDIFRTRPLCLKKGTGNFYLSQFF